MPYSYQDITPADVLKLDAPTDGFLCPLSANVYNIDFLSFKIRDYDTGKEIFSVDRSDIDPADIDVENMTEEELRTIRYDFGSEFLRLSTIGTTLVFSVGPMEVPNFRMIERHYFQNKLIRSFDFSFGFCIPNSTNSWEAIYPLPPLSEEEILEIKENPYETRSDSFYFVNDELIMHNKAEYCYTS